MRALIWNATLLAVLALAFVAAQPVVAGDTYDAANQVTVTAQQAGGDGHDVVPGAVWTVVGVLVFALVGGVFYLLKRRVGGFPRNPSWVAPISIERSATFPAEGDFGDVAADAHGHGAHH